MKVFVTGVAGQLGHDLMNELAMRGIKAVGSDIAPFYSGVQDGSAACSLPYLPLDITEKDAVRRVIFSEKPDAVIHCAAWTAVDAAEEPENRESVYLVNVTGTRYIAEACKELNCKMMYMSTDYVFDGEGDEPWKPDDGHLAPLNVYGESKLEGERVVSELVKRFFIVRLSWAFSLYGNSFVRKMLQLSEKYDTLKVVFDQIGTPTYTPDLSRLLADMIVTEKYGCYHVTDEGGYISWYDFACEIFRQAGKKTHVLPITAAEYGLSKTARPHNSRLDKTKLTENGFSRLPDWQDALKRCLMDRRAI